MPRSPYAARIVEQLLVLRALNALPLVETAPGRGIWRYWFRAAGQSISVDLDLTVLELRCYQRRDEVAMSPVPVETMETILGRRPARPAPTGATEETCVQELRKIVAEWRRGNPRTFMRPPEKVGHPDNWNHA